MIERINDKQKNILLALAKYKFLTYDQMLRLGIERHKSNLSKQISGMIKSRKSYIQKIPHRPGTSTKFYLTKRGKELLVSHFDIEVESIHFPKGKITTDTQDQKHRTRIIDLHLALENEYTKQDCDLLFCHRYFDTIGNNRINRNLKSQTALPFNSNSVKADMIFMLQTPLQKELYIVELENGRDTKKAITKCHEHAELLFQGGVHEKYNFKQGYRTLWVFEHETTLLKTRQALSNDPLFEHISEYFLFNTYSSSSSSFFTHWTNINNQKRKLFYS